MLLEMYTMFLDSKIGVRVASDLPPFTLPIAWEGLSFSSYKQMYSDSIPTVPLFQ